MIARESLGGTLGAMLTGVAVTSGPWLLTTLLLVSMRASAVATGVDNITAAEQVITITYAIAIVLSAPIDIVLTRFTADCVYERRCERIAAPLCRALAIALVAFTIVGAIAMYAMGVGLDLAIPGTILASTVGAQWLLLSAAGGLSSPAIILRAFGIGAPASVISWVAFVGPFNLGPVGYLLGFALGQMVTLGLLLRGILRALPHEEDATASLGTAVREYNLLAIAALAFNAGLWIDKICVLILADVRLASQYAALAAVAWLTIVPTCAYLYVVVETTFYERFRAFYGALEAGASLTELEVLVDALHKQVKATLSGTAAVQLCVTLICLIAAPSIVDLLKLHGGPPDTLLWLVLGAGLQAIALSATMLLYYFDFQREGLVTSIIQLATNAVFTLWIGVHSNILGAGYTLACSITAITSVMLLLSRMQSLLPRTFQSQIDLVES